MPRIPNSSSTFSIQTTTAGPDLSGKSGRVTKRIHFNDIHQSEFNFAVLVISKTENIFLRFFKSIHLYIWKKYYICVGTVNETDKVYAVVNSIAHRFKFNEKQIRSLEKNENFLGILWMKAGELLLGSTKLPEEINGNSIWSNRRTQLSPKTFIRVASLAQDKLLSSPQETEKGFIVNVDGKSFIIQADSQNKDKVHAVHLKVEEDAKGNADTVGEDITTGEWVDATEFGQSLLGNIPLPVPTSVPGKYTWISTSSTQQEFLPTTLDPKTFVKAHLIARMKIAQKPEAAEKGIVINVGLHQFLVKVSTELGPDGPRKIPHAYHLEVSKSKDGVMELSPRAQDVLQGRWENAEKCSLVDEAELPVLATQADEKAGVETRYNWTAEVAPGVKKTYETNLSPQTYKKAHLLATLWLAQSKSASEADLKAGKVIQAINVDGHEFVAKVDYREVTEVDGRNVYRRFSHLVKLHGSEELGKGSMSDVRLAPDLLQRYWVALKDPKGGTAPLDDEEGTKVGSTPIKTPNKSERPRSQHFIGSPLPAKQDRFKTTRKQAALRNEAQLNATVFHEEYLTNVYYEFITDKKNIITTQPVGVELFKILDYTDEKHFKTDFHIARRIAFCLDLVKHYQKNFWTKVPRIFHRDIKTENLIVLGEWEPSLRDLGLSHQQGNINGRRPEYCGTLQSMPAKLRADLERAADKYFQVQKSMVSGPNKTAALQLALQTVEKQVLIQDYYGLGALLFEIVTQGDILHDNTPPTYFPIEMDENQHAHLDQLAKQFIDQAPLFKMIKEMVKLEPVVEFEKLFTEVAKCPPITDQEMETFALLHQAERAEALRQQAEDEMQAKHHASSGTDESHFTQRASQGQVDISSLEGAGSDRGGLSRYSTSSSEPIQSKIGEGIHDGSDSD